MYVDTVGVLCLLAIPLSQVLQWVPVAPASEKQMCYVPQINAHTKILMHNKRVLAMSHETINYDLTGGPGSPGNPLDPCMGVSIINNSAASFTKLFFNFSHLLINSLTFLMCVTSR